MPTATPTETPVPSAPLITGGAQVDSVRIFCIADPSIDAPDILVFEVGPNGVHDGGTGDDELLGTGGTDADGQCGGGLGIALNRPLRAGDIVFVVDARSGLVSPDVLVLETPIATAVSPNWLVLLTLLLSLVALQGLRRIA